MPEQRSISSDEILKAVADGRKTEFETEKLRISFFERIVILCGGTIALSYSAAAAFSSHIHNVAAYHTLFSSWKLLIGSIVLSLLSNLSTIVSSRHFNIWQTYNFTHVAVKRLENITGNPSEPRFGRHEKKADRSMVIHGVLSKIGALLGMIAIGTMIAAFVYLYLFAEGSLLSQ